MDNVLVIVLKGRSRTHWLHEKEIISFLKGDSTIIEKKIKHEIEKASASLNYERALELKNMLDDINITLKKQK